MVALQFVNSGEACVLRGYPEIDGFDRSGVLVTSAERATDQRVDAVRLPREGAAWAALTAFAAADGGSAADCLNDLRTLEVRPVPEARAQRLSVVLQACGGMRVSPFTSAFEFG